MNWTDTLRAEIEAHGGTVIRVEQNKHMKMFYSHGGRDRFYVYPATPSDNQRGLKNALSELRQHMGVRKEVKKSTRPKRRKRRAERPVVVPAVQPTENPLEALGGIRERVALDLRCGRRGLEGTLARIERAGLLACDRIKAWADGRRPASGLRPIGDITRDIVEKARERS